MGRAAIGRALTHDGEIAKSTKSTKIRKIGLTLVLSAHAKINLSSQVVGVRADGYHLLRTVFQTLALHDELTFEAARSAVALV